MRQGRTREEMDRAAEVAGICFLLIGLILCAAIFLQGCASYPRTPAPLPPDAMPQKMVEDWSYEKQPGDDTKFETTVGAARKGLVIGERYTGAVAAQGNAVDAGTEIAAMYEEARVTMDQTREVGERNSLTSLSAGLGVGICLAFLAWMIGGWIQ